ncbi:MAG: NAD-dependent epimerase/dehydratase family protein [Candidatus Thorarchaeota archaeon]
MNLDTRILITGGLGFIGSNLSRILLKDGYENITLLARSKSKIHNISGIQDDVNLIVDDVMNIGKYLQDNDVVYHLASTTDNYAIQDHEPHRDSELNVLVTSHVLDAIRRINPEIRFIFASTFFVVGNPQSCPVDESICCRPMSLYGATRYCGENLTYYYRHAFDLDATVVRFTNVYGPYEQSAGLQKAVFNYFIAKAINNGEITVFGTGDVKRDYIYVDDAVNAIASVADRGKDELYFIGSGKPQPIGELFSTIIQVLGSGKLKRIPSSSYHKKVGTGDFWIDNTKLKSLGWSPEVSIEDGILNTARYYEENPDILYSILK